MAQNQAQNQAQTQPTTQPQSAAATEAQTTTAPTTISETAQAPATTPPATETIPAGTRFSLVLTNPIFSNTTHRGDEIHAQTIAPVIVGDHVVIPGGVFVQGKVDKLTRHGTRSEIQMQSASVIFPDGYVANIVGPLNVETDEGTAWSNPSRRTTAGIFIAPLAGLGIGALIGSAAHTTQSSIAALVMLTHSRQFYVDVGAPMEMTLPQSLQLAEDQVADANREAQDHPDAVPVPAARPQPVAQFNRGTCFTPGTPGTPPTVLPGMPGPNGVPGPPTIIPGTPPTPGMPYPCR
jgi:type IV secretion system protein VirB10